MDAWRTEHSVGCGTPFIPMKAHGWAVTVFVLGSQYNNNNNNNLLIYRSPFPQCKSMWKSIFGPIDVTGVLVLSLVITNICFNVRHTSWGLGFNPPPMHAGIFASMWSSKLDDTHDQWTLSLMFILKSKYCTFKMITHSVYNSQMFTQRTLTY